MRGCYNAKYKISGLTAAKTLMYITAPADQVIEILSAYVTNASNETNEQIEVALQKITTLGTPTGTSVTPAKEEDGDQASGVTCKADISASEPTYDANGVVDGQGAPSLNGYKFEPTPEERPTIKGQLSIGLRNINSVTSLDVVVQIRFRLIG